MIGRKNKSISFDRDDPYQKKLLEYAEEKRHGNFSVYIKQLIAERMESESRGALTTAGVSSVPPVKVKPVEKRIEVSTSGFL